MGQESQGANAAASGATASAIECAVTAMNSASKNMQAMASECFEISKQSLDQATQALEKLRGAHGMDEVFTIQTNFVKESFESATRHARKFSELMSAFPGEVAKTYQDAWLKSVNAAVEAMQQASQTASENVTSYSEAARKSARVFEHRESA